MKTRIIAMLLVLSMLVLALASCGGGNPDANEGNGASTTEGAQNESKWKDVNFNGESIIISLSNYEPSVVKSAGATNSIKYIAGPDAYTTDSVQNAVFDRNRKIATELGLTVIYQECDQYSAAADNTLTVIENFVLADLEDSPDVVNTMSYGVVRAGIKGNLYNVLSQDKENYFDLTTNGWYTDFMYDNTLDESKIYLITGDYFIDTLRFAYGLMVNIDMYDEVFASEGGTESLFELIEAGDWTYDEVERCIGMAYVDAGSIGQNDEEDTYGAVNDRWWLTRSLFSTSGLDIFETNAEGKLQYVEDITDLHNYTDAIMKLTSSDGFNFDSAANDYNHTNVFIEGRALFAFDTPVLTMEGTLLQNMDDKIALVPYPKYTKDGTYAALVSDNGNVGGVLYNSHKFTECSAYLQMAAEESNNGKGTLIYEYYDVTLKYKLSNTPEQVAMLEYIREGLCSPKAMLYDNYFAKSVSLKVATSLMGNSITAGTNSFASEWESQYSAVQNALESTLATYGQQD